MGSAYEWAMKDCSNMEWAAEGEVVDEATMTLVRRLKTNMEHFRRWVPLLAGAPEVEDPMEEFGDFVQVNVEEIF